MGMSPKSSTRKEIQLFFVSVTYITKSKSILHWPAQLSSSNTNSTDTPEKDEKTMPNFGR